MQPTMKLRLVCRRKALMKRQSYLVDSYGDDCVLQQWWEGPQWPGKPGELIPYDGDRPPIAPIVGEWRDVPVEPE